MQSKTKLKRLLKALSRQGFNVTYKDNIYSIHFPDTPDTPTTEILLPEEFPLENKALQQLSEVAKIRHPSGGKVTQAFATPDFHPGDSGVAIGSIVRTEGMVIPSAVGSDINCGMRLHTANLSLDEFLSKRDSFVELMKGDYFFGTRDVTMSAVTSRAMFERGLIGWLEEMSINPLGSVSGSNFSQLWTELERVFHLGSFDGNIRWCPSDLVPSKGIVRDGDLATIGGGNHFVEIQVVESVEDKKTAYEWGVKEGQIAFMVHSGSRGVGKYIGKMWRDKAKIAWDKGMAFPNSRLFPLSTEKDPNLVTEYLEAEATAANYGFLNRLLLAELLRLRLREVYGDLTASLIYDLPHNITLKDNTGWIVRKGATPAFSNQPVIIPGSMGTPSYLLSGLGNKRFLSSASHGSGRAKTRFEMSRLAKEKNEDYLGLKGVDCITLREERKIEEAPIAYKSIQPAIDSQVKANMVKVVAKLQPILTFKS